MDDIVLKSGGEGGRMSIKVVASSCCFLTDLMTYLLVLFQARLCLVSCSVWDISGKTSSMVSLTPDIMIRSPISGDTFRATTSQSWPALLWEVRGMFPLLREPGLCCKFVSCVTSSEYQDQSTPPEDPICRHIETQLQAIKTHPKALVRGPLAKCDERISNVKC